MRFTWDVCRITVGCMFVFLCDICLMSVGIIVAGGRIYVAICLICVGNIPCLLGIGLALASCCLLLDVRWLYVGCLCDCCVA